MKSVSLWELCLLVLWKISNIQKSSGHTEGWGHSAATE